MRFSQNVDDTFNFRTLSIAAAPLVGDGRILGVIEALRQAGDEPFSDQDLTLLNLVCRFGGETLADIERSGKTPA
jgi:GAF domain-containing protein